MRKYDLITQQKMAAMEALQQQQQQQPQRESERAHLFTNTAGVIIPLFQATVTGVIFGLAAGIYAGLLKSPHAWKIGLAAGIGAVFLAWLIFLCRWLALTQPMRFKRLTGLDINGNGHVGQPPPLLRVAVTSEDRRQTTIADVPYADRLPDFARGVLRGEPLSERQWSGAGALFSRDEFREIRDLFLARGWLRWTNPGYPQQGLEITPGGRAALRALARGDSSPTLSTAYPDFS